MRKYLIALLLAAAAPVANTAQQPTFPSRVDLVTIDAVVFDNRGNPVEGLTRDDFIVKEDGVAQSVAAFEAISLGQSPASPQRLQRVSTNDERADAAGRWFFVVFDDANITQFSTPRARDAIVQFIERALAPGDRVMISAASGGSNWIGELPQDREDLLAFVQRLQGERRVRRGPDRIWDHEAIGIALGRDPQARAQVLRRFFENDILIEGAVTNSPTPEGRQRGQELDANSGAVMVQTMARQVYTEARSRIQVSLGTLDRMSKALADARGRKTLLFFSEGFIMDNTLPSFRSLLQSARNANVAIHFVDVGSPDGAIGEAGGGASAEAGRAVEDRDALGAQAMALRETEGTRSVAVDTGGSVVAGIDLLAGLTRIARESRAYYLLGYSPTNTRRDGRFRKIEVTVNRPNVTVRARGGYFATPAEREAPKKPDADTLDPDVRAALDSPFGAPGLPMRLTSYVLGPQIGGKVQTLLVAEAALAPLRLQPRNGVYAAAFDSYVLVHDRDRDAIERNERLVELNMPAEAFAQLSARGLPLQREFTLEPGRYQATVLLRDRASGTIGSVRHEFEVPAPRDFRMTTPIVTDVMQPGATAGQQRPVPIASRTFKAGSRIAAAFEVIGASEGSKPPAVSVSYALKRPDGTTVAAIPPQALTANATGQFGVTIGITLPAAASGEHHLVLSARDEQAVRVVEHVEPIEIVP